MNADSYNPSRGAAGPSQDTRINTPETQRMNCPNCGTENDKRANSCRQCGQALSDGEVSWLEQRLRTALGLPYPIKEAQDRNLEKSHPSQQMKVDSDNPSRGAAGPSQDTRINTPEAQNMYCPDCGAENKESANFCRQCGQALSDTARVIRGESIEGLEKGSGELEGDTKKGQKEAEIQNESGAESKKESEDTNRDKLLRYAVVGVIILVVLAYIGSFGDSSEPDVDDVEAVVPIHGLIDHHDRYNGKRVNVRGHVGSIGWEVWGGHQPGLSDFVLLGPLAGPHPNYAAFCRVDRSHVAEFRDLRQGQAVIVSGRYRYEEGTRPVELEDCRRVTG